jgi:hypothetical protein
MDEFIINESSIHKSKVIVDTEKKNMRVEMADNGALKESGLTSK